jgi:hypothetical protein
VTKPYSVVSAERRARNKKTGRLGGLASAQKNDTKPESIEELLRNPPPVLKRALQIIRSQPMPPPRNKR